MSKSIEGAQIKVEAYHFDLRKRLVEYDDVVNTHRAIIYAERDKTLSGTDLKAKHTVHGGPGVERRPLSVSRR